MDKSFIQSQIKDFETANLVVNDIRSMLTKTLFEGTQENATKLARAYSLLKNLHDVNERHIKDLKERVRSKNYGQPEPETAESVASDIVAQAAQ